MGADLLGRFVLIPPCKKIRVRLHRVTLTFSSVWNNSVLLQGVTYVSVLAHLSAPHSSLFCPGCMLLIVAAVALTICFPTGKNPLLTESLIKTMPDPRCAQPETPPDPQRSLTTSAHLLTENTACFNDGLFFFFFFFPMSENQ